MGYQVRLSLRDDGAELEDVRTASFAVALAAQQRFKDELAAAGYAWYKGRGQVSVYAHPDGMQPDLALEMRGNV